MTKPAPRWPLGILLTLVMLTSSCASYNSLPHPLITSIPKSIHEGDKVRIVTTQGVALGKLTVKHIWADSLLVGNDTKPIPFSAIAHMEKRKFDPVLTTIAVVLPITGLVVLIAKTAERPLN